MQTAVGVSFVLTEKSDFRHYRTFIQTVLDSGIEWAFACESVTTPYLKTNQDRPPESFATNTLPTTTRRKAYCA
jgi:hypothetical protein